MAKTTATTQAKTGVEMEALAGACIAIITLSNTRTLKNDDSGDLIQELAEWPLKN